jgi:2-desacetyl-2-hydroxyethyl bacteriochlorophyllide A dehydrogenase
VRAVRAYGAGDFRLEDVAEPTAAGGAVIRVDATGVCAADRMIYRGASPWTLTFPFVPGHEFVGTVVEIDAGAAATWGVGEGDLVTAEVIVPCGSCRFCLADRYHLCRHGDHLGSALPGGWAEYMRLPPGARVWSLPEAVEPWQAVLVEPLSCGIHAAERATIRETDVVVVAGIGPVGAGVLAAAAERSPALLVALVTSSERAELARALGAGETIDVRTEDARARLAQLAREAGPDVFIDASGSTEAVELGLDVLAPGGRLVVYGVYGSPAAIDLNVISEFKELEIRGGHLSPGAFPDAIRLLSSGALDSSLIVSHREPLERFEAALEPSDGRMRVKAIIEPYRRPAAAAANRSAEKESL